MCGNREAIKGLEIKSKFRPGIIKGRADRRPFKAGEKVDHGPEYFGTLPEGVGLSRKMGESEIRMREAERRNHGGALRRVPGTRKPRCTLDGRASCRATASPVTHTYLPGGRPGGQPGLTGARGRRTDAGSTRRSSEEEAGGKAAR